MVDSKFLSVRALVQSGSLTNLATTSPWTVTHSGGTGLTLTSASRITAESLPNGKPAALCSEVVVTLDTSLIGSTVLSSGRATLVVVSTGQLRCLIDGSQVDVLNIPLAGQRVLCAIEYTSDAGNENYFFRATGETSGGTVTETASVVATAPPGGSTAKVIVGGGTLVGTVQATPAQGSVSVALTRAWAAATAVPHIIEITPYIDLDGRTAAATAGRIIAYASINGSVVTYDLENIAGMTVSAIGAALANGIATASNAVVGSVGGVVTTVGGRSRLTTATNAAGQNWQFWCDAAVNVAFPAEPGYSQVTVGGNIFIENPIQTGVYGTSTATTQTNAITLTLPSASATMTLSVSALPTLSVSASMANITTGLNSLTAQLGAAGFTATWQQTSGTQYVISTERTTGSLTLSAGLTVDASSIPNPVTTLHALRVTAAERYTLTGVPAVFPTLPWPTTNIPPPQNFSGDVTLGDSTGSSAFFAEAPKQWGGSTTADSVTSTGTLMIFEPTVAALEGAGAVEGATSIGSMAVLYPVMFSMDKVVPSATLFAEVVPYEGFRLDGTIPAATGIAWFGIRLDKTLPSVQLQAVGTVPNTLRLAAELPNVTLSANILNGRSFSVNANVPPVSLSAWTGWKLSAIVPVASMTGGVVAGGAYRLNASVPMASVQSSAVAVNVLRLTGTVPAAMRSGWVAVNKTAPAAKMMGGILPVVAITRLAYSFTLANSAMTRYPSYPFIQVFRMGNAYYGVAEDGLYELGGATDNGTAIPWAWETCMSDFGSPEKKTVVSAYLGGYVPQNMAYTIKAGDLPTGTNAHTTTATSVMRNHRQKFGIGRKSRFFAFGLSAAQGRVAIESIEFELAKMSRRV